MMDKDSKIVIIGAGVFGLSTAYQLASEGYRNIFVLDRHAPPVPDGSSTDISRVVRFDYADDDYMDIAYEAYEKWRSLSKYEGIFYPCKYVLAGTKDPKTQDSGWMDKTTAQLTKRGLPWTQLENASAARRKFATLTGELATPHFFGYTNAQAGWADATKAMTQLRDDCIEFGVSMLCGKAGTVVGLDTSSDGTIKGVKTAAGNVVQGDKFILTAGSWVAGLVPMYNSVLSTAQVLGYTRLTDAEMEKYKDLPIYANFSTGWFNFPPHNDTNMLKIAIHGWGYTREPTKDESGVIKSLTSSTPPLGPRRERANFVPADGEQRLRQGLREMVPELADRPFERLALCWYTDTPTGDFIMDYHPDFKNLFIGGAGSGHAFKFLPVLGEYMSRAIHRKLPSGLASKWRFRTEYKDRSDVFLGDGSRGGPQRRELSSAEKAKLDGASRAKL